MERREKKSRQGAACPLVSQASLPLLLLSLIAPNASRYRLPREERGDARSARRPLTFFSFFSSFATPCAFYFFLSPYFPAYWLRQS